MKSSILYSINLFAAHAANTRYQSGCNALNNTEYTEVSDRPLLLFSSFGSSSVVSSSLSLQSPRSSFPRSTFLVLVVLPPAVVVLVRSSSSSSSTMVVVVAAASSGQQSMCPVSTYRSML